MKMEKKLIQEKNSNSNFSSFFSLQKIHHPQSFFGELAAAKVSRILSFTSASVLSLILLNTGCSSSDGVPAAGDMCFDENQAEIHKIING